ncbi:ribonuclease III, partial [Clostridium perfringens]
LQEEMQKSGEVSIVYELLKYEGPPHRRKFFTSVIIEDKEFVNGEGYSKKESEQNAAKEALRVLEELNE